ncbi:MAG: MBL fold metallo-hydrolase [Microbacteriaceae bacterium]|nr:MBL fold metallo-hydrolase [Microbacteriaceae bacterium]
MPEQLAEDTWIVSTPVAPIGIAPPQSNCVVLADADGLHLVDPGEGTDAAVAALEAGLAELGFDLGDVRSVTATHLHRDHFGMADRIRERSGSEVVLHRIEQEALDSGRHGLRSDAATIERWGVPDDRREDLLSLPEQTAPVPDAATLLVEDGDRLPLPTRTLRVIHTPGHTSGHICLHESTTGLLLLGDHVLFDQFPGVGLGGPSENPLGDYLASLDRIPLDELEHVVPGHGVADAPLTERVAMIRAHHARRTAEARAARASLGADATVWEVASRLSWSRGWDGLHDRALRSALAQTEMHLALVG